MTKTIPLIILSFFISINVIAANLGRKAKVAFHWNPQAEFAGFYIAKQKGIYTQYGLDVEFLYCEGGISSAGKLISGEVDFATLSLVEALLKRSEGLKLVELAQLVQKNPKLIVSKISSGIKVPKDLNNRKIGLWRSVNYSIVNAFYRNINIIPDVIPVNSGIDLFIKGGVDSLLVMKYNEYHSIINSGINPDELTVFSMKDFGLDIPYTGIFAKKSTFVGNGILCRNFIEATMKGWEYAFKNKKETVEIVLREMEKYHKPANEAHQKWMLKEMNDCFEISDNKINTILSDEKLMKAIKILKSDNLLKNKINYSEFNKTGDLYAEK